MAGVNNQFFFRRQVQFLTARLGTFGHDKIARFHPVPRHQNFVFRNTAFNQFFFQSTADDHDLFGSFDRSPKKSPVDLVNFKDGIFEKQAREKQTDPIARIKQSIFLKKQIQNQKERKGKRLNKESNRPQKSVQHNQVQTKNP